MALHNRTAVFLQFSLGLVLLACGGPGGDARDRKAAPPPLAFDLGGVTMEFILVPAGTFMMGDANGTSGDQPVHQVTFTWPFYVSKYQVTQEQWQEVMGGNPSHFKGPRNPVDNVSWDDCQQFLAALSRKLTGWKASLPTEAQWEYACRAGCKGRFCFGDDESKLGEYGWFDANAESATHPVGMKKPNAWGLYDMHGNTWEWCNDWFGDYTSKPQTNPQGPATGSKRVLRGGAFLSGPARHASSYRRGSAPDVRQFYYGLRVVLVAVAPGK
jgi:formylglycine-generating enzyme required for sulfatase activity